ncbi:hypothetical protein KY285_026081 [Solanum tuberosum]|nr:hypothetical protein KY285_026081 [Solanum tuberosum]
MNILSKTWLQAWSTLPDLEFCLHRGKCNIKIVDTIMERYRDGKVPIEKFELSRRSSYDPHKVLPPIPIDNCLDIAFQNGVSSKDQTVYLKVLKIRDSEGMWEIDAPNLVSFEYTGKQIPEFKIARQLENSKIYLYRLGNINADWFCKLRKFLSKSTGASWSQVSIRFKECTEIKMEHLQQHYRVGATTQVDVLEVNVLFQLMEWSSFVDALLWSCLPKRLNLQPRLNLFAVFSDRLMYMKNSRIRPWHSQLKETKSFDENNQLLQLGSEQLTESVLPSWGSERRGG